ncbi:glycosyltransferase family 4 protein [Salisediminibacterium selenitireducens]|uniref:Glycosyl transferase group 1 n=1 Tax=Bacillus selenitireducens (strain ATCC 700615 / DSM 15326 / MLS10) TaxID=439292 RepID=D6Y040_BACIE|nr:glycosyltransferase family 4 protein [Salisediminibacterium selenitireducens]ADI00542.1 glycosyl transferase group 1 [[Bacillus] selenitireducens MLS10]
MNVFHLISGAETGGSKKHILTLLASFDRDKVLLGVFEWGAFAEEAEALGIRVRHFRQSSRYDFSVKAEILQVMEEGRFELLHSHGPRANLLVATMKRKLNVPWVVTVHSNPLLDFMNEGVKGWIFTKLHVWALRRADGYFAVTPRFRDNLVDLKMDKSRIAVVYNGVDFDAPVEGPTLTRADLGIEDDAFTAVMVARMHPVKDHITLLKAFDQIREDGDRLLLVGDGPYRESVEEEAAALGMGDTVSFLGQRKDAEQIMAISDVVLLTSLSESFPLVLLEAAKVARPVISTDVGGVNELIAHENSGWVVPVQDQKALSEAIAVAREKKAELPQMGLQLHSHAKKHFSLKKLYIDTIQFYDIVKKV